MRMKIPHSGVQAITMQNTRGKQCSGTVECYFSLTTVEMQCSFCVKSVKLAEVRKPQTTTVLHFEINPTNLDHC